MPALRSAVAAGLLLFARVSAAQWATVYANDFDDGDLAPEIAPPSSYLAGPPAMALIAPPPGCASVVYCTPALGAAPDVGFENHRVTVGLTGGVLAPHTMARFRFSLFVLATWDGNHPIFGPDFIVVGADGVERFRTTFSNDAGNRQSYPGAYPAAHPARAGTVEIGTLVPGSSIYEIALTIPHTAPDLSFFVAGENLQGGGDEWWAIDNLRIDLLPVTSVPEPGTAALVGAGLIAGGAAARRRRSS